MGKRLVIRAIVEKMLGTHCFGSQTARFSSTWRAYTEDDNFVQLDYPCKLTFEGTISNYEMDWYNDGDLPGELVLKNCVLLKYEPYN